MFIDGTIGWVIDGIVVLIILFLFYVLSMVWPPDSPWAPWWQMPKDVIRKMYKMVGLKSSDVVYELGCGIADAMVIARNEFGAKAIGIEIDPLRIFLARINVWKANHMKPSIQFEPSFWGAKRRQNQIRKDPGPARMTTNKITIIKDNFFNIDLSDATVLIIYLVPKALGRLSPKFIKELKKGTRIVSYKYTFPKEVSLKKIKLVKEDKKNEIYFYEIA